MEVDAGRFLYYIFRSRHADVERVWQYIRRKVQWGLAKIAKSSDPKAGGGGEREGGLICYRYVGFELFPCLNLRKDAAM